MKYRKKPVVIEAVQLTEEVFWDQQDNEKLVFGRFAFNGSWHPGDRKIYNVYVIIDTLEGRMKAELGDWIIKGIKGEFYPCKPDIFNATYDPVDCPSTETAPAKSEEKS